EKGLSGILTPLRVVRKVHGANTKAIIKAAQAINPVEWVEQALSVRDVAALFEQPSTDSPSSSDGTDELKTDGRISPRSLRGKKGSGEPPHNVCIVLVPTRESWQIPAFLKFGAMNEAPPSEISVSLYKHWHEKYGIDVIIMDRDSVSIRIGRLPKAAEV